MRLVLADALPGRDEDFDDRHILEVADVGKPDFVRHACLYRAAVTEMMRRMSSKRPARWRMKRAAAAPSITL